MGTALGRREVSEHFAGPGVFKASGGGGGGCEDQEQLLDLSLL